MLDSTTVSLIIESLVIDSGPLLETPAVVTDAGLSSYAVESIRLSVCVDVIGSHLVVVVIDSSHIYN